MSSEVGFWHNMRDKLAPYGLFKRLENRCELGTPDVLYCLRVERPSRNDVQMFDVATGLLELKEDVWPARPSTPLNISCLTREQVIWQREWEKAGGRVATFAKIDDDYLWLEPEALREVFQRRLTRAQCKGFIIGTGAFPKTPVLKRMLE